MPKSIWNKLREVKFSFEIVDYALLILLICTDFETVVRSMHGRLREGSVFSFNYNTLLLVASILAGLGLASNSSAMIISSMLVSPIMGPVVGMAYGATIRDWRLTRRAFKTEVLSLFFCILMGAILGACMGPTHLAIVLGQHPK